MDKIFCDSAGSQRDCKLDSLHSVYCGFQQAEGIKKESLDIATNIRLSSIIRILYSSTPLHSRQQDQRKHKSDDQATDMGHYSNIGAWHKAKQQVQAKPEDPV